MAAAVRGEATYVDATDLEAWKNAVRPNTKAFLIESPANPLLEVTAIGAVAEIAHAAGAKLMVDNVFATPIFQKPLRARRRHRRLFGHQAHRRPGPGAGRAILRPEEFIGQRLQPDPPHRPGAVAVQRLGAAEGAGDAGAAGAAQTENAGKVADVHRRPREGRAG